MVPKTASPRTIVVDEAIHVVCRRLLPRSAAAPGSAAAGATRFTQRVNTRPATTARNIGHAIMARIRISCVSLPAISVADPGGRGSEFSAMSPAAGRTTHVAAMMLMRFRRRCGMSAHQQRARPVAERLHRSAVAVQGARAAGHEALPAVETRSRHLEIEFDDVLRRVALLIRIAAQ